MSSLSIDDIVGLAAAHEVGKQVGGEGAELGVLGNMGCLLAGLFQLFEKLAAGGQVVVFARVLEEIKLHCCRHGYCVSRTNTPTRGAHGSPGFFLNVTRVSSDGS